MKRNEHLKALSREHHLGLLFCWKLRQGIKLSVAPARISQYVGYFDELYLLPHFKAEEELLFKNNSTSLVQKALGEHVLIKEKAANICAFPEEATTAQLQQLADELESHIRFEERVLFPQMELWLTEEQMNDIGTTLAQEHDGTEQDKYTDEFWIKAG